ncbi:efflux RND transporter periplasmic adaptor subunit [Paenimyroides tangerinum]|uniref:Efflux RND transporter periplasmic adaptor subunit n=1 Tax=Paenimyroides tangerinum TaxID=2488728 RepID=A0A3P3WF65_9FLAO|nr:efflux RND transporter periplasmic adaptor subunit [Paenimyroides tangerinum]RRJ92289.1 efflux RND transporter periplasmic adaptor subunit [Paenimyroides tangerinum]
MKINTKTLLLLIGATSIVACSKKEEAKQAPKPALDVVETVVRDVTGYQSFPAVIEGKINNDVRAKIQGYIKEVLVHEGQSVSKGQILFRLETNVLNDNAAAAKASISAAQASVSAAQVEVNKLIPLVEKKIIASVQLETAKANLASAKSMLAQAQANYQSINANIDYGVVRSPVNGVVGTLPFKLGSLVGPNDSQPLTTVSDVSTVYANFAMNEKEYFKFLNDTPGQSLSEKIKNIPQIELQLADGSLYPQKGKMETASGQVDQATGTVQFRVAFPNPNKILSNGNSGSIRLPRTYTQVLVIPEVASYEQQGKINVYKVKNDTAYSSVVNVIDRVDNMIIVSDGAKEGEVIVVSGIGTLRDKTAIQPKKVAFDSIVNSIKPIF